MTTLNYPSLLSSHNLRAFLRVIREGESNQEDDGPQSAYRAMYHPTQRKFYSGDLRGAGHPQAFEPLPDGSGRKSSAFGAYQFVWTTWNAINEKYGLPDDIAPYVQDCHAVALIYDCGALDDVIDGNLDAALRKCGSQWASLPGSIAGGWRQQGRLRPRAGRLDALRRRRVRHRRNPAPASSELPAIAPAGSRGRRARPIDRAGRSTQRQHCQRRAAAAADQP